MTEDLKVVLLGGAWAGKTCIALRYIQGKFIENMTTVGAVYLTKRLNVNGVSVKLELWDTAGQERFRSLAPMYYRGAHAAILVYEITSQDSFNACKSWYEELERNAAPDIVIAIAASKKDLESERKVEATTGAQYAASVGAMFTETSAKTNEGIDELFEVVVKRILEVHKHSDKPVSEAEKPVALGSNEPKKGCC